MSAERHAEELNKLLLRSARPSRGFELMRDAQLLPFILPELGEGIGCVQNIHHRWDVFNHNLSAVDNAAERGGDLVDRYAALLHDVGKPRTAAPRTDGSGNTFYGHEDVGAEMIPEMFGRLRLAHDMTADVQSLVGNHMYATLGSDNMPLSDATIRRFIRNVSRGTDDRELARERIERQFTLRYCDRKGSGRDMTVRQAENDAFEARVRSELAKEVAFTTAQLAVDGRDVIAAAVASRTRPAGYKGDRLVGQTLQKLLDIVLEMPDMNERSRLLDATNKIFAERDDDHQESRGR
jgi:tRNA nucleotidyltransferase (CCA-adding enzyme)